MKIMTATEITYTVFNQSFQVFANLDFTVEEMGKIRDMIQDLSPTAHINQTRQVEIDPQIFETHSYTRNNPIEMPKLHEAEIIKREEESTATFS